MEGVTPEELIQQCRVAAHAAFDEHFIEKGLSDETADRLLGWTHAACDALTDIVRLQVEGVPVPSDFEVGMVMALWRVRRAVLKNLSKEPK